MSKRVLNIPSGATVKRVNRAAFGKQQRAEVNESELELELFNSMVLYAKPKGLPLPERQVAFDSTARRIDIAISNGKVAVEVQGGTYAAERGKHSRGAGQRKDFHKLNALILAGWLPLQFDAVDIEPKNIIATIETIYATVAMVEIERRAFFDR